MESKVIGFYQKNDQYWEFSNWYPCKFKYAKKEYSSLEQYMMYQKAIILEDNTSAERILKTDDPKEAKDIAKAITTGHFSNWEKHKYFVVKQGVRAKLLQNKNILFKLLGTGNSLLAECSPTDREWGIGLSINDDYQDISKWNGKNYLGRILMELRYEFKITMENNKKLEYRDYTFKAMSFRKTARELINNPIYHEAITTYQCHIGDYKNTMLKLGLIGEFGSLGFCYLGYDEMLQALFEIDMKSNNMILKQDYVDDSNRKQFIIEFLKESCKASEIQYEDTTRMLPSIKLNQMTGEVTYIANGRMLDIIVKRIPNWERNRDLEILKDIATNSYIFKICEGGKIGECYSLSIMLLENERNEEKSNVFSNCEISIITGDITELDVDAIVNAANTDLLAGGGVCGAIFKKAGYAELQEECDKLSPIKTGEAIITSGYSLKAKHVIHAVGPVYHGPSSAPYLEAAYLNSLKLADENGLESIAFPSISTGIYGYPKEEAAKIAIKTVKNFKPKNNLKTIVLVCFDNNTYELYKREYTKE